MQRQSSFRIGRDCQAFWITFNQNSYGRIWMILNCVIEWHFCWVVLLIPLASRLNTHCWNNVYHLLNNIGIHQEWLSFQYVVNRKISLVVKVIDSFRTINKKQLNNICILAILACIVSGNSFSLFLVFNDSRN